MDRGTIRDATRALLADANVTANALASGGQDGDAWTNPEYNDAIEYAIGQYGINTGAFRVIADLGSPSGSGTSNNVFTAPSDILIVNRVMYGTSTATEFQMRALDETTIGFEIMRSAAYRSKGTSANDTIPKRWAWYSGNKIMVFPDINSFGASTHLYLDYTQKPTDLASDGDTPDARVLEQHHRYLKFAAASWLLLFDPTEEDSAKAKMFMDIFLQKIKER